MIYKPHIQAAQRAWKQLLNDEDVVIDATCGNGHDTLFLARQSIGKLYAIDIQSQALIQTQSLLQASLSQEQYARVRFVHGCHSTFPQELNKESVKLIVYNLGYLPKGDKAITTQVETTVKSIENALKLIQAGGLISITCYPGHPEGQREEEAILNYATTLNPQQWSSHHQRWINRPLSPNLLFLQKTI